MKNAIYATTIVALAAVNLLYIELLSANYAQALEINVCYSLEELNPLLKSEAQRSLIIANQSLKSETGVRQEVRVFTSDDGGSGYILNGDKPIGQRSNKMCVDTRLTNVKLFSTANTAINPETQISGDRKIADKQCQNLANKICGYHNDVLANTFKNGLRVMLQAGVNNSSNNSNSTITILADTVAVDVGNGQYAITGSVGISSKEGAAVLVSAYRDIDYTDYARARLAH